MPVGRTDTDPEIRLTIGEEVELLRARMGLLEARIDRILACLPMVPDDASDNVEAQHRAASAKRHARVKRR